MVTSHNPVATIHKQPQWYDIFVKKISINMLPLKNVTMLWPTTEQILQASNNILWIFSNIFNNLIIIMDIDPDIMVWSYLDT